MTLFAEPPTTQEFVLDVATMDGSEGEAQGKAGSCQKPGLMHRSTNSNEHQPTLLWYPGKSAPSKARNFSSHFYTYVVNISDYLSSKLADAYYDVIAMGL